MPPRGEAVLVSWVSVNRRAAPMLSALDEPSPLARRISRLYLCWRDASGATDLEAVCETERELERLLDRLSPEVVRVPWKTEAQPTDHGAIRPFAEQVLKRVRKEHPAAHIFVHLSPGTPAMHAVWLVLCSTGFIDGPLTMIQGVPEEKRKDSGPPIESVPVEVDSWLKRFRSARPADPGNDDDGALWEPNDFGETSPMRRVLDQLLEWAPLRAPVLILGERGTGKTTLANFLRASGPFQRLAPGPDGRTAWPAAVCGQLRGDPQMARSELFGHRRGAFTGALDDRQGLVEAADGDCLFLDEIGDLDRATQRMLMGAVEGRGFQRVGEATRRFSSFRLIAATNRPLDELLGEVLDEDFYDRIAVFSVRVPPLRECRDDLPVFWRSVLRRVRGAAGVPIGDAELASAEATVLSGLREHHLPGNLRDLQRVAWRVIARLHRGADGNDAATAALKCLPEGGSPIDLPEVDALRGLLPLHQPLDERLVQLRGRWVEAALAEGGSQQEAADLLGVKRETFRCWLKR